jgi:hypothetical protein
VKPLRKVVADESAPVTKQADYLYALVATQGQSGWLAGRVIGPLRRAAHRALGLRAEPLEPRGYLVPVQRASLSALPVTDHAEVRLRAESPGTAYALRRDEQGLLATGAPSVTDCVNPDYSNRSFM